MRKLPLPLACALLAVPALAACGGSAPVSNRTVDSDSAPDVVTPEPVAVRVGELGSNFQACPAAGTTRHLEAGETLPVRVAPFDNATQAGAVATGGRFFICTRSLDQKWFGIVYPPADAPGANCGVSDPLPVKRSYAGPCASGWVESAFVKMVAGTTPDPVEANRAAAASGAAKGG
ncbi:MAG: hypothetical protein JOZ90_16675 [Alphaproteobacteria bacterium]|nr:hypothetical protein [Alphaproteobacteria bacterium]MBV9371553.1 hypothetical protein [Alphaproteobacteria bacterium]MBV9902705.1 hypothetical protein [Alphaproteobacteria bacterium]